MQTFYTIKLTPARIAIADLSKYADGFLLHRINVPPQFRRLGHGSALLKTILADADAENATLYLWVSDSGGLTAKQLDAWYSRHGFVNNGGLYCRKPIKGSTDSDYF